MRLTWSTRITAVAALFLGVLDPPRAHAAGFAIAEQGTAATGMVGAFTAKADDASAIFYNPAGLAPQKKLQVYVGGVLILGQAGVNGTSSFPLPQREEANFLAQALPTVYLAYGLPHDFAIGIGAFTNFGLKVDWPQDFSGRFVGRYASLQSVTINPTIAWRPVWWFAFGGGLDLTPINVDIQRGLPLVAGEAQLRFTGNDLGVGGNVGILLQGIKLPGRERALLTGGVSYRSSFDVTFDDGAFNAQAPPEFSQTLTSSRATATLRLPDQLSVGVGVRPVDRLFIQLQYDWVRWGRLQNLTLQVADNPSENLVIPEQWRSGHGIRAGAELELGRWRPRLGFGYDWTPAPATTLGPLIPESSRWLVSAGLGAMDLPRHFALELSLMGVIFQKRTSQLPEFPVEYSNWALLISGAVSFRGDRPR